MFFNPSIPPKKSIKEKVCSDVIEIPEEDIEFNKMYEHKEIYNISKNIDENIEYGIHHQP